MRTLLYILILSFCSTGWSQVIVEDTAFLRCLTDNYPTMIVNTNELETTVSNAYSGDLNCSGYSISDLSILTEFASTKEVEFSGLINSNLSPTLAMTELRRLKVNESTLQALPDFSLAPNMTLLRIENSNVNEFPSLPAIIQNVSFSKNNISEVVFTDDYPSLLYITLSDNTNLTNFSGLDHLINIKELSLSRTSVTSLESFENNDSLEILRLSTMPLQTQIEGLGDKTKMRELILSELDLNELPAFSYQSLTSLWIGKNFLTFEDLLPIRQEGIYPDGLASYTNQYAQGVIQSIELLEKERWQWELDFDQGVTTNYYLWYKDGELIDSTLEGTFVIDELSISHEGVYTCRVKNTEMPEVTIDVNPITLNVESTVTSDVSKAFSPNGDGSFDTFYIEETGTILIYSERGILVRTLDGPEYWDGKDNDGQDLPFGYYMITVDDHPLYGVTIVK